MKHGHSQRGASLVEALVAVAVLGVGSASITGIISSISNARRQLAFQATALELFSRLNTEIQSSTCLVYEGAAGPTALSTDPAFLVPAGWQNAVPPGSRLSTLGDFVDVVPHVRVEYRVAPAPGAVLVNGPPSFEILVRVREIDSGVDQVSNIQSAHFVRTWPIRKSCSLRTTASSRGGYP